MLNKILDPSVNPSICKPGTHSYAADAPRLNATPGDRIAILYAKNGHVTNPRQTKRPFHSGNVNVYGTLFDAKNLAPTTSSIPGTRRTKCGNKQQGRLLGLHFYDDLRYYEDQGGNELDKESKFNTTRREQFDFDSLSCQTAFKLSEDLPSTGIHTVVGVWDWPQIGANGNLQTEIYTSCDEIQLRKRSEKAAPVIDVAPISDAGNATISYSLS